MFGCAFLFLVGLAVLVTHQIDLPTIGERTGLQDVQTDPDTEVSLFVSAIGWLLLVLWPVFFAEAFYLWFTRPWSRDFRPYHWHALACCLIPPLKLGACWPEMSGALWLPKWGWQLPDDQLRNRLKHFFSVPMIGIAVLILPVIGVEFFMQEQVDRYPALRFCLNFGTGLIWFAFAAEFIVMISVAERKLVYCKQHWLDLAIILLPVISFLRSLRILRATKLAKMTKVQQLSKMARIYRLRGVSTKALRALILIEVLHRLFRTSPKKRLRRLYHDRRNLERDLAALNTKIAELERLSQTKGE